MLHLKASEATVATATGAAKTAAVGFPQNIPLLIGYALQAAGIIGAITSAVRGAKSAAKGGGSITVPTAPRIPGGRGAPATATAQNAAAPQEFDVAPTNRAYVLSGDVRTQQEADAKLAARRTLS